MASGAIKNMNNLTVWEKLQVECIDLLCQHAADEYEYFKEREGDLQSDESKDWLHFRVFMFDLYSVLDYTYFLLYCHFANKGELESDYKKASQCGFPHATIKIPRSPGQNHFEEDFRKKHLGFICGSINHNCRDAIVEIIYKIQPKKQVDGAGKDYKPRDIKTELEDDERSFAILHYFRNYSQKSILLFCSQKSCSFCIRT